MLLSLFDCTFAFRMTTEKRNMAIVEFVSFCIERYKLLKSMSGKEVADLFQSLGVVNYLITNYEILHTQNADFIQEEIELFIKAQRV